MFDEEQALRVMRELGLGITKSFDSQGKMVVISQGLEPLEDLQQVFGPDIVRVEYEMPPMEGAPIQ